MNSFGRAIAIIITAVLIFLLPMQYVYDAHYHQEHTKVTEKTIAFTEDIRIEGQLTLGRYEEFLIDIGRHGSLFDVELEIAKAYIGSASVEDKNQSMSYSNNANSVGGSMKTLEIGKGKSSGSFLSTHTHSAACYNGDLHRHSGTSGLSYSNGCYTKAVSTGTQTTWCDTPCTKEDLNLHGSIQQLSSSSWTCSKGKSHVTYVFGCTCGATSTYVDGDSCHYETSNLLHYNNYNYYCPGHRTSVTKYELDCGKIDGSYYNGSNQVTHNCANVVLSIVPSVQSQTVKQGVGINSTVLATYLDGQTKTITTANNYNGTIGNQTVTLTYTGLVGNAKTTGTRTATTEVITTPKKLLVSLSVTPSSSWVYNGSEPTYIVVVNYDDGSSANITNYTKTGFTKGSGNKQVVFTYTEEGKTVSVTVSIVVKKNIKTCNYGHTYELDDNDVDNGCNICASKVSKISVTPSSLVLSRGDNIKNEIRVIATYFNESTKYVTEWTSDFNPNQLGSQYVTISYQGATSMIEVNVVDELICSICGNGYNPLPDGSDGGCPTCSTTIMSLRVTPSNQTILKDTPLPLTVIAIYKDGSSREVKDYTSNFNSSVLGEQKVTVYYGGITAVVQVTVTDDMITCNVCGNTYSWKLNPLGCPFCSTTIVDMEAYVSGGGNYVVYGSELALDIILIYKDGHRELALEGYEYSGYEPYQLGEQRIRVVYGSFDDSSNIIDIIDIIVINNMQKVTCNVGHVYYLNEDGSDPGCGACFSGLDQTKQGSRYEVVLMTEEILEQLENNKKIVFENGDYITVRVLPREKENRKSFYHLDGDFKSIIYGGRISNES